MREDRALRRAGPGGRRLGLPKPLLAGRRARPMLTSDTPGLFFRLVCGAAMRRQVKRQILAYCGVKPRGFIRFPPVETSTGETSTGETRAREIRAGETRARWLARARVSGAAEGWGGTVRGRRGERPPSRRGCLRVPRQSPARQGIR
jgi:hypothetical protein